MLCFLLQINVMHLNHECQFSLSSWTVATVNASNVGTLKTGLQHTEHIAPAGFSRTHKPNIAYVGDGSTQKTKPKGGCWLRQCMRGYNHEHQGQRAVACHPKPASSFSLRQTREETHTEQRVAYPPHPHSPPHSVCCPHTVSVAGPIESESKWNRGGKGQQNSTPKYFELST